MSDVVPEPPALDPTELAGRTFGRARRGFEQAEVGAALGLAADALRLWQERDERLRARIEQLEAALEAVNVLDSSQVASLLGPEAVEAVRTAREAADEIRRRAESEAGEAVAALRAELDAEAELARSETEQLRAEVLKAAEAELAAARRRGREMVGEARAVRERMLRDLAERRRTARQQIAAAQAGRDVILEALRAAGVAVDGATHNLGGIDNAVARAAERAALSVEDDIDRFVDTLRERLGGSAEPAGAELAQVTRLEDPDAARSDEPQEVDLTDAVGRVPDGDDVVVELVVPDPEPEADDAQLDEVDGPEVVGDLALATSPSELAAARRTVGADAEVIEFATAVRRPAAYFVDDDQPDDTDDIYDDLDDDYDDYEFEGETEADGSVGAGDLSPDDAAAAAATVHDLITRMRESADHADGSSAPGPTPPVTDPAEPAD